MTLAEYDEKMSVYAERLRNATGSEFDALYEEVSNFQYAHMEDVLLAYKANIDCEAKGYIYSLLEYAVHSSSSGNSTIDVESEEILTDIDNIIWEEIGDYLLDYQTYKEETYWVVDCMFGGNYVPCWDGWKD